MIHTKKDIQELSDIYRKNEQELLKLKQRVSKLNDRHFADLSEIVRLRRMVESLTSQEKHPY